MVYNKTRKNNKFNRKKQTKYKHSYHKIKNQTGGIKLFNTNPNPNPNPNPNQLIPSSNNINRYTNPNKNNVYNSYKNTTSPLESNNLIQRAYQNPDFFAKIAEVVKKGLSNVVQNMSNYVGIDPTNPNNFKDMLIAAKNTLENTSNLQELAVIGSLVLEAATPFIQPLIDKIIFYGESAAEKIGKAIINVILNTMEEIPIYGILVGTIRTLNTIAVTILSSINTSFLINQRIKEALEFTLNEFESLKRGYMIELQKQKAKSMNRIEDSIKKFNGGGYLGNPKS